MSRKALDGWLHEARTFSVPVLTEDRLAERIASERDFLVRFIFNKNRNIELSEDIAQTAILRALRYIHTYDGSTTVRAWLCVVALNVSRAFHHMASAKRRGGGAAVASLDQRVRCPRTNSMPRLRDLVIDDRDLEAEIIDRLDAFALLGMDAGVMLSAQDLDAEVLA